MPEVLEFDIRGQICPSTLLVALKAMNEHRQELRRGRVALSILASNRDATVTIPEAAVNQGYRATVEKVGAHYVIAVTGGVP